MVDDIEIKTETLKPSSKKLKASWDPSKPPPETPPAADSPHPRDGYVVEVWLGEFKDFRLDEETGKLRLIPVSRVLVEIHECYNIWAQPESLGYHYRPYDLLDGMDLAVLTIGALGLDLMREFAKDHSAPKGTTWRRLR